MDPNEPVAYSESRQKEETVHSGPPKANRSVNGFKGFIRETVELIVVTLVLLVAIRQVLAEARYIPSGSMEPTLQVNDRLLVEKVSGWLRQPIRRGDILVFYPPPQAIGGQEVHHDPLSILGQLTGLPFLPYDPAFIKRVIGLPGDHIRIQSGVGVYINGELLDESFYAKEPPNYDLTVMGDIHLRQNPKERSQDYNDGKEPIIVPPGHLFMMGDNRNNSEDSHVWGFLDEKRVIGRACLLFWRHLTPCAYPHSIDNQEN